MITVKQTKFETLVVPDEDTCGSIVATHDTVGWTTIRDAGHESLVIDKTEWSGFVNLINELNAHMMLEYVGAYAPKRESK